MENQLIEIIIWYVAIIWTIAGLVRIFFPNLGLKKYMSGEWKIPRDNLTRFGGLVTLVLGVYVLLYLLGYIK